MSIRAASVVTRQQQSDAGTILLSLLAHSGFGLWVVLVKLLLQYLPPFRLSGLSYTIAVPITFLIARRYLTWHDFWRADLWLLSGMTMARSVFKLLALQLTLATYVQLLDLSVPFLAPIVAWALLRERMPAGTLPALAATSLGSFLVITKDPFDVQLPHGQTDALGLGFALVSSAAMATGIVYTRWLTRRKLPSAATFFQPAVALSVTYWLLSAASGESWRPFGSLALEYWLVYAVYIGISVIGGGLIQALAISRSNASLYATLLSWRLVVALIAGWLLVAERLTTWWQVGGVAIVVLAITLYSRRQALHQPLPRTG